MSYTADYYHILGLPSPRPLNASKPALDPELLRSKYREALLRAHPDKQQPVHTPSSGPTQPSTRAPETRTSTVASTEKQIYGSWTYTVDDVREAFAVLSDASRRSEYDIWLRSSGSTEARKGKEEEGFILGLEVLDLSDFEEVRAEPASSSSSSSASGSCSTATSMGTRISAESESESPGSTSKTRAEEEGQEEQEEKVEWRRPCRCGVAAGFVIPEQELEDAICRGEDELLVGCAGCSLWVRVEFGIAETVR